MTTVPIFDTGTLATAETPAPGEPCPLCGWVGDDRRLHIVGGETCEKMQAENKGENHGH